MGVSKEHPVKCERRSGVGVGAQTTDRRGAVKLEGELADELAGDCLKDLAGLVAGAGQRRWQLRLVVPAPGRQSNQAVALRKLLMERAIDVALVTQHRQSGHVDQRLFGQRGGRRPSRLWGEVEEAHGADHQMQLDAVDRPLLGCDAAVCSLTMSAVVAGSDRRLRHAIDCAHVHFPRLQHPPPPPDHGSLDAVGRLGELLAPVISRALGQQQGEGGAVAPPVGQVAGHRARPDHSAMRLAASNSSSVKPARPRLRIVGRGNPLVSLVDHDVDICAEIHKVPYHGATFGVG